MTGFSLIELLLVIALLGIVGVAAFPLGTNLYRMQVLQDTRDSLVTTLRQAQVYAMAQKNDASHGVKFLGNSYVLFEGDSYDTRNESNDFAINVASNIALSGLDEVVFAQFTGLPSATGTITLSLHDEVRELHVLSAGITE